MSQKIIHFDIRPGKGSTLDIASMFPMTQAHPVRDMSVRFFVDDMRESRPRLDFTLSKRIQIVRFRTISTLDVALRELVDPALWQQRLLDLAPRPHTLDLVPPLDTPYGALDLRRDRIYIKKKTHPDLYTRRLPRALMMARTMKEARRWSKVHRRGIIGTLLTLLMTTVPTVFFVKYSVEQGYEKLIGLKDVTTVSEVRSVVASARDDFERANFLFFPVSWIPSETIDLADRAIDGGRLITRGMTRVLDALPTSTGAVFSLGKSAVFAPEFRPTSLDIYPLDSLGIQTPTDWIEDEKPKIVSAFADMSRAGEIYDGVSTGSVLGDKMHSVGVLLSRGMKYFSYAIEHDDELLEFLGHDEPIRYLLFNQNRDEIRANGGFPGSVVVFTLYKGNILDLRRDDIYYYDWNLYPYKETPPPGLALLTENYGLRDVNYYPDFRITLEKANNFIERSGDSTITSGIAVHQGFIEDILAQVGPVTLSGVTIPFDETNFSLLMSTLVENQFAREHHPKDILFQFGRVLLTQIHEQRAYETVFDTLESYWRDGEILFASRDRGMDDIIAKFRKELPWECEAMNSEQGTVNSEQGTMKSVGVSSERYPPSSSVCSPNWIYPIFTSVSGNKSDRYITRTYESKTKKIQSCTYENVITLSLAHTYRKTDTEKILSYMDTLGITDKKEREKLEFIEGDGKNRAYTRLYVPKSAILGFTGADITVAENEYAKVYSFLLETPVGGTTSKTLRYTVDIPGCESIPDTSVAWMRQPGIRELIIKNNAE